MSESLRVGILGTAAIATKVRRAIVAAGHRVVAIGSRDAAKGAAWAAQALACGDLAAAPAALSYEGVLAAADVDAVYIPLPCGLHREWVCKAAAAGKHVIVEKPAAASVAELEAMLRACRDARVCFLDGTMFHFHPRAALIDARVREPRFGPVGRVASSFSFRGDAAFFANNIRTSAALERFGCVGDLGQYCIRFGLNVFDWELPATVRGVAVEHNAEGVPMNATMSFSWPAGGPDGGPRTLLVDCAFTLAFKQTAEIIGTNAVLTVTDFTIPRSHAAADDFTVTYGGGLDASHSNVVGTTERVASGGNQEEFMWRAFGARVRAGAGADAGAGAGAFSPEWASMTLATQACLDAAMESMARDGAPVPVAAPALYAELRAAAERR